MRETMKTLLSRCCWLALGRRNMVRLGRFLSNEARLDCTNEIATNGEILVQRSILAWNNISRPLTVFDVGANIGAWTRCFLDQAKGRQIALHVFEPCPGTADTLERNLRTWGIHADVLINRIALTSDNHSEAVFFSTGDNEGTNSLYRIPHTVPVMETRVPASTLDSYAKSAGVERIELLKIDAEGHDMEVILGGSDLFGRRTVDLVQFEYNHRWIYARRFLRDAFYFFLPLGYRLGKLTPLGVEFYEGWDPELETYREGNYLAVRGELSDGLPRMRWWKDET